MRCASAADLALSVRDVVERHDGATSGSSAGACATESLLPLAAAAGRQQRKQLDAAQIVKTRKPPRGLRLQPVPAPAAVARELARRLLTRLHRVRYRDHRPEPRARATDHPDRRDAHRRRQAAPAGTYSTSWSTRSARFRGQHPHPRHHAGDGAGRATIAAVLPAFHAFAQGDRAGWRTTPTFDMRFLEAQTATNVPRLRPAGARRCCYSRRWCTPAGIAPAGSDRRAPGRQRAGPATAVGDDGDGGDLPKLMPLLDGRAQHPR